jgi:sugar phosphate isomerase/epimerase
MMRMTDRRNFLKTAGLAGVGTSLVGLSNATAQNETPYASKLPRLFTGCCAYSYNAEFKHGSMTLEDFILKAVDFGLDGVDITVYYLKSTDPDYLVSLRHLAYKQAMPFSGVACRSSMVQADAAKRAETLKDIQKWIDVTDQLGASHLRIFAGPLPPGANLPDATQWVVDAMKAACDYSGKKGITLGLEDHQGVTQSADVCLEVMQKVNSPYAGINLDITNFVATPTQDAYAQIAACLPYATNTHIRNHFVDQTPVDMDRVWRLFAQAGYKGYMSAEYEPATRQGGEPGTTGVPKLVAEIKTLCKKYSTV